ncbi:protein kinase, partial [Actinomyces sp. MRS3W]|nr:protein kinase [Actinomyces sp. MRS3W]
MRRLRRHTPSHPHRTTDSVGSDDLAPEVLDALITAGLAVGSPLGTDREGRLAPRRGLDAAGRDVVIHVLE